MKKIFFLLLLFCSSVGYGQAMSGDIYDTGRNKANASLLGIIPKKPLTQKQRIAALENLVSQQQEQINDLIMAGIYTVRGNIETRLRLDSLINEIANDKIITQFNLSIDNLYIRKLDSLSIVVDWLKKQQQ